MAYRVGLIADNHFIFDGGRVFVNGTYTQQYLRRFTSNFDELVVIARARDAETPEETAKLRESGGERVSFHRLQDFYGIKDYILLRKQLKRELMKALEDLDALFVRMPCILTTLALECAKKKNIPVMIDVGADPDTIYRSPKPTAFELVLSKYMKRVCQNACMSANGVSYVTRSILQEKYPCHATKHGQTTEYFTASISNVDISDAFFYDSRVYGQLDTVRLLHISNNIAINSGKGHYECIDVLKKLVDAGVDATITFVGGGDGAGTFEELADRYGIKDRLTFTGRIADREQYRNIILDHDIFLFPSHSEGLPRVLIEVMATGMVCVSSNVDGIPELLDQADIFDYSDVQGMSDRIRALIADKDLLNAISKRNYQLSRKYSNDQLKETYDDYYGKVRLLVDKQRGREE